ncbi:MAG: hypothetical protein WBH35_06600 [Bacillota bacterium]|jgi:hypothetical protein|nr:hypothetical protein [Bacillota bacterium]HPZ54025.1 hypothetical protein [Bacillota bacterium]HQD17496.1 hypothetical protein [Bacillota bacterium]
MPRRPQVEFKAVYSPDMDRMVKALQIVLRRWDTQDRREPDLEECERDESQAKQAS